MAGSFHISSPRLTKFDFAASSAPQRPNGDVRPLQGHRRPRDNRHGADGVRGGGKPAQTKDFEVAVAALAALPPHAADFIARFQRASVSRIATARYLLREIEHAKRSHAGGRGRGH
jgi:hypothetical protein